MALFNNCTHPLDHLVKFGTTFSCKSLRMRFLEEPQFLKSDDSVPTSDLEVELGVMLAMQPSAKRETYNVL